MRVDFSESRHWITIKCL